MANCKECRTQAVRVRNGCAFLLCEDCRRDSVTLRLRVRKVKRTLGGSIHRVIQYYESGWRAGYLLNIGDVAASVQPIGGRNGICPDIIRVSLADIKPETMCSAVMPTVEDYYSMTDKKKVPVLVVQTTKAMAAAVAGLPKVTTVCGLDLAEKVDIALPVQETNKSTEREQPKPLSTPRASKHAPIDMGLAFRLYQEGGRMKDVVEAVRGQRAAGGCANDVRNALKAAGLYREPSWVVRG